MREKTKESVQHKKISASPNDEKEAYVKFLLHKKKLRSFERGNLVGERMKNTTTEAIGEYATDCIHELLRRVVDHHDDKAAVYLLSFATDSTLFIESAIKICNGFDLAIKDSIRWPIVVTANKAYSDAKIKWLREIKKFGIDAPIRLNRTKSIDELTPINQCVIPKILHWLELRKIWQSTCHFYPTPEVALESKTLFNRKIFGLPDYNIKNWKVWAALIIESLEVENNGKLENDPLVGELGDHREKHKEDASLGTALSEMRTRIKERIQGQVKLLAPNPVSRGIR